MALTKLFIQFWKSISVIICILYLSFAPPSTFNEIPTFQIPHIDKIVHLLMFLGLTIVLIFDYLKISIISTYHTRFVFICLVLPVILGGVVELMQRQFFAPRTAEWGDWLSDIIGILLGWLFVHLFTSKFQKIDPK